MTRTLRKGQAKVQFLAHKEDICKLLECGHSMIEALEILQREYKDITMKYQTFRRLIYHYIGEEILIQHRHSRVSKSKETIISNPQDFTHQDVEHKSSQLTNFLKSDSTFKKSENTDPNDLF